MNLTDHFALHLSILRKMFCNAIMMIQICIALALRLFNVRRSGEWILIIITLVLFLYSLGILVVVSHQVIGNIG